MTNHLLKIPTDMNQTLKLGMATVSRLPNLFALAIFAALLSPLSSASAQQNLPFDVFGEAIDNRQVYMHIERNAVKIVKRQPANTVEKLRGELDSVGKNSNIKFNSLACVRPSESDSLYRHMVKSSVYLSELYNCGRCDRTHAGFSGGVIVSEDGLVLTNHHVLEGRETGRTEGFMAMTYDGTCWEIEEVVASDAQADIALVRLKSKGHKFYAAPIAQTRPDPMDPIRIISNPSGEFFVLTEGEVSRYSRMRSRTGGRATWMEVTAEFGGGSSGSAVFNSKGEVVGLVSRIKALVRKSDQKLKDETERSGVTGQGFVEMILRRCVPLSAIHDSFDMK